MDHVFGKDGNSETSTDNGDNCPLCFARGFICEECRSEDVIFPFQPESEVKHLVYYSVWARSILPY